MGKKLDAMLMYGAFTVNVAAGVTRGYAESKGCMAYAESPLFSFVPISSAGILAGGLEAKNMRETEEAAREVQRKVVPDAISAAFFAALANVTGYYLGKYVGVTY